MTSLRQAIFRGSLWSFAGGAGQQVLGFVVFLYLARVLSPAEIGLVALAVVLIEVVSGVAKLGVVEALQAAPADPEAETAVLAALILAGLAGFVLLLGAGVTSWLTGYWAELAIILMLLAPIALMQALNALPEGLLRRRMDFRSLALRNWTATSMGGVAAVACIQVDLGLYALVGQRLAATLASTGLLWAKAHWRPELPFEPSRARPVLSSGWKIVVGSLANLINSRFADFITGFFLGPTSLGLLRLGWRFRDTLVQLTVTPLSAVALSSFSKLQAEKEALCRTYLGFTKIIALVSLPVFYGLGVLAEPIILLVLGEKWIGAAVVFVWLGPLMTAGAVNYFFAPMMIAAGRPDIVMRQSIGQLLISIPMLWIGSYFGMTGILAAHTSRALLVSLYNLAALQRHLGIRIRAVLGSLLPGLTACCAMVAAIRLIAPGHVELGTYGTVLATYVMLGIMVYFAVLLAGEYAGLWPRLLRDTARLLRQARHHD